MATAWLEEGRLKRAGRCLKTRGPVATVQAAVDLKAAHDEVVRKHSGVGQGGRLPGNLSAVLDTFAG